MTKSRSFPKLDKPPRRKPTRSNPSTHVTKDAWIAWRMKMGAGRKEAGRLWTAYRQWLAGEAQNPRPRVFTVEPWQDWEREFKAWLDEMPRRPTRFLAMVAEIERKRVIREQVTTRKAAGRERYQRRYQRNGLTGH